MNENTLKKINELKNAIKSDETYINYLSVLKELTLNKDIYELILKKNNLEKELEVLIRCEKGKDEIKILTTQKEIKDIYSKLQEYDLFNKALLLKREYENLITTIQKEIFDTFEESSLFEEEILKRNENYKDFDFIK